MIGKHGIVKPCMCGFVESGLDILKLAHSFSDTYFLFGGGVVSFGTAFYWADYNFHRTNFLDRFSKTCIVVNLSLQFCHYRGERFSRGLGNIKCVSNTISHRPHFYGFCEDLPVRPDQVFSVCILFFLQNCPLIWCWRNDFDSLFSGVDASSHSLPCGIGCNLSSLSVCLERDEDGIVQTVIWEFCHCFQKFFVLAKLQIGLNPGF